MRLCFVLHQVELNGLSVDFTSYHFGMLKTTARVPQSLKSLLMAPTFEIALKRNMKSIPTKSDKQILDVSLQQTVALERTSAQKFART